MSGGGQGAEEPRKRGTGAPPISLGALAGHVGEALVAHGWTLAVAESCTAGLVMKTLTDPPGSSRYLAGGVVAYANRVKVEVLGVDEARLDGEGAVSEFVARAMADGVSRMMETPVGLSVTGIAGPEGGTPEKPVGTVWLAVRTPHRAEAQRMHFSGDRDGVREQSARAALGLLDEVLRTPERPKG